MPSNLEIINEGGSLTIFHRSPRSKVYRVLWMALASVVLSVVLWVLVNDGMNGLWVVAILATLAGFFLPLVALTMFVMDQMKIKLTHFVSSSSEPFRGEVSAPNLGIEIYHLGSNFADKEDLTLRDSIMQVYCEAETGTQRGLPFTIYRVGATLRSDRVVTLMKSINGLPKAQYIAAKIEGFLERDGVK